MTALELVGNVADADGNPHSRITRTHLNNPDVTLVPNDPNNPNPSRLPASMGSLSAYVSGSYSSL